ncbi:MAG: phosphatidate cytidylyltransferase [Dehalococcoidia bacterium]
MLQRVLTALVGIPLLVGAIWWGFPWLLFLVLVASVLALAEFYRLLPQEDIQLPAALGIVWVVAWVVGAQASTGLSNFLLISGIILLVGSFIALLWLIAFYRGGNPLQAAVYLVGGPIYVGFLLSHALTLRELDPLTDLDRNWLLFALLVTFATDTGAFFTGRSIGRHPLVPNISPNKTWEGAVGGFLAAIVAALLLDQFFTLGLPRWQPPLIGATVGVVAQWGDLLESKLKRISQVKDAGSLIPGHGGMLDRLDSILLAIPAVYYLLSTVFRP